MSRYRNHRGSAIPVHTQASQSSQIAMTGELPPYEPPTYALNARAQDALNRLYTQNGLSKATKHYDKALKGITTSAGHINDLVRERQEIVQRRRARIQKKEGRELGSDDEEVQSYEEFKVKVDDMTRRLEETVRKAVDGKMAVEQAQESLAWLKTSGVVATQREFESQRSQKSQSQRSRRRREQDYDPDNPEDEDEEMEDADGDDRNSPGPTPFDTQGRALTGPSELFTRRMQSAQDKYSALSHATRYSTANDYVGFKRVVHDALVGEDGPPLPHASTWFTESGAPAPGITATSRDANAEESDDDIAIARERISTKCPITLQEFKDPVTSSKCPHSFERDAILVMIRRSPNIIGIGGRKGERAVQCPVSGCNEMLSAPDLQEDQLLIRKIWRIQKSKQQESDEDEEEEEDDDDEERGPVVQRTAGGVGRDEQQWNFDGATDEKPPRSSVVVDLGASDDDSDE